MRVSSCLLLVGMIAVLLGGCATTVTSVPWDDDEKAIPYYLPKPYLMITRGVGTASTTTTKTTGNPEKPSETVSVKVETTGATNAAEYKYQIIYLPDLNQKRGLKFDRGIGSYKSDFTLADGWKLTGFHSEGDSQVDETITAVAGAAEKWAAMIESADASAGGSKGTQPHIWIYDISNMTVKPLLCWSWPPETEY